ncbi:MAG: uroporphyrinogen decarboxylase [Balneola sp.]|nr:uroporphyrinogen decarboxylase [Balneola sp.]|tara:strand:- start:35608 stop:36639 length:1032 start_codon:yes stop_codon:yes gene_type:complete
MSFPELKNRLLLDTLEGKETERPPVWMMRQAGRYLPEYMEIKKKYSFFERVKTPELASEITIQPIDIVGTDAAILFSDILVLIECLDVEVQLKPGFGPYLPDPIRTVEQVNDLNIIPAEEQLSYVYDALTLTRKELDGRVPLIGFAGAPWTLFCYLVEGQGSKTFSTAKSFLFSEPEAAQKLLEVMTDQTIQYLHNQVKAGAQALQVFESWAAALGPDDFQKLALPHLKRIANEDYGVPLIMFCKDAEWSYPMFANTNVAGFGIGWGCTPEHARQFAGDKVVQGNFDPSKLLMKPEAIEAEAKEMMQRFGKGNYIANLGHGILPNVPVENAKRFVDTVKNFRY